MTCIGLQAFLLQHSKPKAVDGNVVQCLLRLQRANNILTNPLRKQSGEGFIKLLIKLLEILSMGRQKISYGHQIEHVVNLEREQMWTQEAI